MYASIDVKIDTFTQFLYRYFLLQTKLVLAISIVQYQDYFSISTIAIVFSLTTVAGISFYNTVAVICL